MSDVTTIEADVPERYADQLVGAALTDNSGPDRSAVLRPPR